MGGRWRASAAVLVVLGVLAIVWPAPAPGRQHLGSGPDRRQEPAATESGPRATVRPSGLRAVFPKDARCPDISSPFGSQTRYDGSPRVKWANEGHHGGMDISLPEGTPLLALATGTVVAKGEGGLLEGIYVWIRHAPDDTGLPDFIYAKYQHLSAPSSLDVGARVAMGDVVGPSGKTGTVGGYYGPFGYAHLHLGTIRSPRGDEPVGSRAEGRQWHLVDPLAVYRDIAGGREGSAVTIPYTTGDGKAWPEGTRAVWPVACVRKSRLSRPAGSRRTHRAPARRRAAPGGPRASR